MLNADIMKVNVENLTRLQLEFLKGHLVETLKKVIDYVEKDDYESIKKMLVFSPAGDFMGEENYFINFSYTNDKILDINDIISEIECLKKSRGERK